MGAAARRSWVLALAVTGLAAALVAPETLAQGFEDVLARVRDVEVRGLRTLEESDIKKILKTRGRRRLLFWERSDVFRNDFLRSDEQIVKTYAGQHGFLDATVLGYAVRDTAGAWVDVIFEVAEGRRSHVRGLTLTPTTVYPESELRKKLNLKLGEPFNPQHLTLDRRTLLDLYAERAYFPRIVTSFERTDSVSVSVKFEIDEGPLYRLGKFEIVGLREVDTTAVRREVVLQTGQPFRSRAVQRSAERVYETRLFQYANFEPTRFDTVAGVVDVRLRVRESKHRWIEGGVGFSSLDGARVLGEWGHGNVSGKGRTFALSGRVAFSQPTEFNASLRYVEPWLFGTRTRGRVAPFIDQHQEDFKDQEFSERSWGVDVSASRELNRWTDVTLGFTPQWQVARTTPDLPDSELTNFQRDQFFTTRITAGLSYDQRDDIFDPFKGQYHLLTGQYAGQLLGSQGEFLKGIATGTLYRPVKGRTSLALRVQVGGINPIGAGNQDPLQTVPITDLFKTGGSTRVRGYGEDDINGTEETGGLMLINTNAELRFPVWRIVAGAVFLDGGNVWTRPRDFKFRHLGLGHSPIDGNQYRWAVGTGVRLRTPVGPFRFDLGYRLQDEQKPFDPDDPVREAGFGWHLSIGQAY